MTTEIQRQREELSDKISALERIYSTTSSEQRSMDLILGVLEDWVSYKSALEELYGGKANIQIAKHSRFLVDVKTSFDRGMEDLIEDYETQPNKSKDFVQQIYQNARRYWQLYTQGGLHRLDKEKKHVIYGQFVDRLRKDLDSLAIPTNNTPIDLEKVSLEIYEGKIQITNGPGTKEPFQLILGMNGQDKVYWLVPKKIKVLEPDDVYTPVEKNLPHITKDDIALVLATAYIRESNVMGIPIDFKPEDLAKYLPTIVPQVINGIYQSVEAFRTRQSVGR